MNPRFPMVLGSRRELFGRSALLPELVTQGAPEVLNGRIRDIVFTQENRHHRGC